ncbi:MAG: RNA polymerase sigma factor [Planctomycetota bacterium]|jgi:RNA polymerase sigma-70 factor (ECF subfamily)
MPGNRFKDLVDNYGPAVLNTAIRILRDSQKAQDVHQEVFLEIWRRWHKFNGATNWGAYLYRVTVRKAIELAKQAGSKPRHAQIQDCATTHQGPDERLKATELEQKIVECLTALPKRQADVLVLARIERLKHEKIAQVLGCSEKTVRVHLHRALKRLARQLKDYMAQ